MCRFAYRIRYRSARTKSEHAALPSRRLTESSRHSIWGGEGIVPQRREKFKSAPRSSKALSLGCGKPSQEALLVPENDEDFARGRRLPLLLGLAAAAWIVLILLVVWGPTLLSLIAQLGLAGPVKVLPPLI